MRYIAALLLTCSTGASAETLSFQAAGSAKAWSFYHGAEFPGAKGGLAYEPSEGHADPGCLALSFSFAGGNYVQAATELPTGNAYRAARLWIKKPSANRMTIRVVDSGKQTFQKGVDYASDEWQALEVDLTHWQSHFGGANDGQVRWPLTSFAVLAENTAAEKRGRVLIDDIEFVNDAASAKQAGACTYTAIDFATAGLGATGGQGNQLQAGRWEYRFNGGEVALHTQFSLLGAPSELRLVLESDGSGHEVGFQLGSHFQQFSRIAGKLSVKGEQTITVPLGDMKGWDHHSGQNDGVARMPLRIQAITLRKADGGPQSGTLVLKRLEAVTAPRGGQHVIIVPDVQGTHGPITFSAKLMNLRDQPTRGRLVCDVRTLTGLVKRHEAAMELPAKANPQAWSCAAEMGQGRFLEARFQWFEGGYTSTTASIGTCRAGDGDLAEPSLDPQSIVGAGLYLYRWQGHPQAKENMERLAEMARRAGVKWTREEILWNRTEPEKGRFEWAFHDQMLDVALKHGISVYGLLDYWSEWTKPYTDEGVEDYCRWATQVVRRYKGRIHHWEIWNEPNIFFWSGPKELYAKLLTKAYAAIKAEDPTAVVLGCSTAGIDTNFIRQVMGQGAPFDALTIHPYRGVMNDLGFMQELRDVRELVGGRDVWLTEIGFPTQLIDGYSERNQASLVARVYLASAASGAARSVSWYDFRNDSDDPFYNEMNFGLVRHDLRPKPGYGTLASVARTLGHLRVAGSVDVGPNAYAFRFTDGRRDVVAVCAPEVSRLLSLNTAADAWSDAFEGRVVPGAIGDSQVITLTAGFPVFIHGPAGFALEAVANPVTYTVEPAALKPGDPFEFRISRGLDVVAITL